MSERETPPHEFLRSSVLLSVFVPVLLKLPRSWTWMRFIIYVELRIGLIIRRSVTFGQIKSKTMGYCTYAKLFL